MTEKTFIRLHATIGFTIPNEIHEMKLERASFNRDAEQQEFHLFLTVAGETEEELRETIANFKQSLIEGLG